MTDIVRRKDLCIKVIRSHLISCPGGLTLKQLEHDYEASESQKLPYRMFGYTDLLSFLKSLADVVRLDYHNGQVLLHGIADESSQHIKNMVDHQRKKSRARPPRLTAIPRRPSSHSFAARRVGFASASTRRNVFKILQDRTSGIPIPQFFELYRKEIGITLSPLRQGFRSATDFFLSMPDVCRLEYGRRDRSGNNLYLYLPKSVVSPTKQSIGSEPTAISDQGKSKDIKPPEKCGSEADEESVKAKPLSVKSEPEQIPKDATEAAPLTKKPVTEEEKILNDALVPTCQRLRSEILEILDEETNKIWAAKVPVLYKSRFGKELRIKELGYFSIIEFLSTLTNEISITRPNPKGDWLLMKRTKGPARCKKSALDLIYDDGLRVTLMEIKELLIKSGEGIPADKLCSTYERIYRHKIELDEGDELLAIFALVIQIKGVCIYQEDNKVMISLTEKEKKAMGCSSSLVTQSVIPVDSVCPNASYRLPELPSSDEQYIDVFVADVTNPEYFTVQICGKKTTGALNALMDNLEKLYCSPEGEKYKIPQNMIQIGQICAAVFMEDLNWHRAVIVQVYDTGEYVDVLYVDYGSVSSVPPDSLRLLKSCFMYLPAQMIKARLAHIKPRNLTSWSLEARNCMLDMCRDRPLVGMITGIENRVLSLCLCDTTKPDIDLHINDTLVEKKHAVFFPDGLSNEQAETLHKFLEQQIEAEKNGKTGDFDKPLLSVLNGLTNNQNIEEPQHTEVTTPESTDTPQISSDKTAVSGDNGHLQVKGPSLQRYIQKHGVLGGKHSIHVINYEGNPMVASFEISLLFRQSSDILRPLLLMNNLHFNELVIGNDEKHAELFEAIRKHKIPGYIEKGVTKSMVCLYRLQDIPGIVDGLGHTEKGGLISDIVKIMANFDADEKYWYVEDDPPKIDDSDAFETLRRELHDLEAKRKNLIEQLANESSSKIVDEVISVERRMCDIEEMVKRHSTCPKEVTIEAESNVLCDALVNQYGSQLNPTSQEGRCGQACTKGEAAKVAEVAPYMSSCKKEDTVNGELSMIPGAQIPHEIVEFVPRERNATVLSEQPPPLLVSGASGSAAHMQNVVGGHGSQMQCVRPEVQSVPDGFVQHNMALLPRRNNSPHVTQTQIGLPQWSCMPIQQTQHMNSSQLFRDASGQVYLRQVPHPGSGNMAVSHSGFMYATNQNPGVTIQPAGPFPLYMQVPGMH